MKPIRKPRKGKEPTRREDHWELGRLTEQRDNLIEQKRQLRDVVAQILSYGSGHESPDDYKWEYAPIPQCALDRAREILKQTK